MPHSSDYKKASWLVLVGAWAALNATNTAANGTVTAPLADYNSAQVVQAGGALTVPFGAILANAVYTVTAGTTLEIGSKFTVTLPTNFLFQSEPTITAPAGTILSLVSGGIGANSITFQIAGAAVPAGGTLSVGQFTLSGAAALESPFGGNPLSMTFQSTNNSLSANNDAAPISVAVFAHAVGSLPDTITPGSGHINVAAVPPGTQFVPSGATVANSALVAVFAINTELNDPFNSNAPVLSPNGLANSLSPSDTVTIIVKGDFTGIATAYADPTIGTCSGSVPSGSFVAAVTSSSLTFTGILINTPIEICMIPDGVTLLRPGPPVFAYTYNAGTSTDFFGGLTQTTANNFYTYSAPYTPPAPPTIAAAFGSESILVDGTTSLTFVLTNPGTNTVSLTGVAFMDTLPAGMAVATPNGLADTCGGTASAVAGSASIALSGATIAEGSSCTVVVNVIDTAPGNLTNTTAAVTADNSGASGNMASAVLNAVATQSISDFFATPTNPNFSPGGSFSVSAVGGGSGNPVTFSIAAASAHVCSASGATISILAPGTCTVLANQAGDLDYAAAAQASLTVVISGPPAVPAPVVSIWLLGLLVTLFGGLGLARVRRL
jgi:uncharacterized repeat protein (TIGR01451 family)